MDVIEERAHNQLRLMRATADDLRAIRVRVSSPDGLVTVDLDGVCSLVGLQLAPGIAQVSGRTLGGAIVATCAVAAREVMTRRAEVMTEFHRDFGQP